MIAMIEQRGRERGRESGRRAGKKEGEGVLLGRGDARTLEEGHVHDRDGDRDRGCRVFVKGCEDGFFSVRRRNW